MQYEEETCDSVNNSFDYGAPSLNMGTSLCLKGDETESFSADVVHDYYDYLEEKELGYRSDATNENLSANTERKWAIESVEKSDHNKKVICEQWLSDIHGIEMDDLFTRHNSEIHGENIRNFISRLREGQKKMKQQDDADRWESYFELRLIALCEFALEHDYGIRLSV